LHVKELTETISTSTSMHGNAVSSFVLASVEGRRADLVVSVLAASKTRATGNGARWAPGHGPYTEHTGVKKKCCCKAFEGNVTCARASDAS